MSGFPGRDGYARGVRPDGHNQQNKPVSLVERKRAEAGYLRRMEKIAVVPPIPMAKVRTTTAVNPGDLRKARAAKRQSCKSV
jgi:hypothetical protein